MYVASGPLPRASTCENNVIPLVQPTVASHNFARSLPPPPPRLEGEDTDVSRAAALERNRRAVPDSDLDASVDLGEAIARTPTLMPRPKSRFPSPMLPDYLLPMHDATPAPVIGARQPGEAASSYSTLCLSCTH